MKNIIITIGREYGSGGRYIGEELSKRLNIPFYDKEIINRTYDKNGGNYSRLLQYDEKKRNRILDELHRITTFGYTEIEEKDYNELLERTIKDLSSSSCIILGRNSNNILKNNKNVINVFVYSNNLDFKVNRKMLIDNLSYDSALKKLKEVDKNRKKYYESLNKGKTWGDKQDYDLLIDSGIFGIEKTIDLLEEVYNKKSEE